MQKLQFLPLLVASYLLHCATPMHAGAQDSAQSPSVSDSERQQHAREFYSRGQAMYRAADYEAAEVAFWDAYRSVPNPVVLLAIAESRERRGWITGAVEIFERYLSEAPASQGRESLRERIRDLRERPAQVVIRSIPQGASLSIDGMPVGTAPYEGELPEGLHTISATFSGRTVEKNVEVPFGDRFDTTLDVTPPSPVASGVMGEGGPIADLPLIPVDAEQYDTSGPRKGVWVAAGIAGASLVTGTVFGFLALSEQSSFDSRPSDAKADRGERYALFADLAFGLSASAAVTAIVLAFVGPDSEHQDTERSASISVTPLVSPAEAGVGAKLEF
ncbi:MAG: PEGA domain-containing protein [Myxococcota bacterium]